ncbi:creatininase family protein [Sulfuracidifex metallicus]|uniref:creatininase family protein n=1 Tax=Sulfuracidifex metallicus TaxID=47303 RepID=UPI00227391D3|nr:creatininase family protein [Sulfuracidifex metallicus]MCY0850204.1 creatininase family protein [Sulfuracidifex metallicus]
MKLLEVTRDQVKGKVGVIAIGSIEQHGPHLPMGTDSLMAEWLASQLESSYPEEVILFPTLTYGCSFEHGNQPFIGVSYINMINFLTDLAESTKRAGLLSLIIVNGHGGNESLLDVVRRQVNFANEKFKVYLFSMVGRDKGLFNVIDMHAGSVETSRMFFLKPSLVRMEKLKEIRDFSVKEGVFQTITTDKANPYGVINVGGDVQVDPKKGEESMRNAYADLESLFLRVKQSLIVNNG